MKSAFAKGLFRSKEAFHKGEECDMRDSNEDGVEMRELQAIHIAQPFESDSKSSVVNRVLRPYYDVVDAVYWHDLREGKRMSYWSRIKFLFLQTFCPSRLKIGRTAGTFSMDRRSLIATSIMFSIRAFYIVLFIYLLQVMIDGYKLPQVDVSYNLETDGFELPMVAVCGEMLNFQSFSAFVGSSEASSNSGNNVGVESFVYPQSSAGLPAFASASHQLIPNELVSASDGTVCIQTDNVGTSKYSRNSRSRRRKQSAFFTNFVRDAIRPFYPFLAFDGDAYLKTPSCVV